MGLKIGQEAALEVLTQLPKTYKLAPVATNIAKNLRVPLTLTTFDRIYAECNTVRMEGGKTPTSYQNRFEHFLKDFGYEEQEQRKSASSIVEGHTDTADVLYLGVPNRFSRKRKEHRRTPSRTKVAEFLLVSTNDDHVSIISDDGSESRAIPEGYDIRITHRGLGLALDNLGARVPACNGYAEKLNPLMTYAYAKQETVTSALAEKLVRQALGIKAE